MRGQLQVSIENARDLLIPEVEPTAPERSLYVAVALKGEVQETTRVQHGKSPIWNEQLMFSVDVSEEDKVHFVIHSISSVDDKIVGKKVASMSEIQSGSLSKSPMPLKTSNGKTAGYLNVDCNWTESVNEPSKSKDVTTENDFIGRNLVKLTGPRPPILRIESYYSAVKIVYMTIAGLPILNKFSPILENIVENVLQRTPLKVKPEKPEEGAESIRVVDSVDRRIEGALNDVDRMVDQKKDEALRGICDVKNKIKGIKPKDKNVVEATVQGIAYGAGATKSLVGNAVHSAVSGAQDLVGCVIGKVAYGAGATVGAVKSTACSATEGVKHTVFDAADTVKSTAGQTVNAVKTRAGSAVDSVKSTASSVVDTAREKAESFSGHHERSPLKSNESAK
jgi:hypothetical protein